MKASENRSNGNRAAARILVMISGSIAAYKTAHILSRLVQAGHEVEVVASPWALKFIGEATIEGLIGRPVRTTMFGSGHHMVHIDLIRWADLAIVCPATANTINKLSRGLGDDLMTTLFLAHDFKKPWLLAPAMNSVMYHHPVTQESIARLRSMGCEILETASGVLACGEVGDGKLLDPDLILKEILIRLQPISAIQSDASLDSRRILITSGGTTEPIDAVRAITNTSTGRTGAQIAETFLRLGCEVTFLSAKGSIQPKLETANLRDRLTTKDYVSFQDLAELLQSQLQNNDFDVVIHAAAVSDYSLAQAPAKTKIDSDDDELTLRLRKNPKLLKSLKEWSRNKNVSIVAFKLTATTDLSDRAARLLKILSTSQPDFIVTNDLNDGSDWSLHRRDGSVATRGTDRKDLGYALAEKISKKISETLEGAL